MEKALKKPIKVSLIVLLIIITVATVGLGILGICYLNADALKFEHVDSSWLIGLPIKEGSSINYPHFGNLMTLGLDSNGKFAGTVAPFMGTGGRKNLVVYDAVNTVVFANVDYLARRECSEGINLDYTVKQDNKTITVNLNGTGTDSSGKNVSIDKALVFNIENASAENLPIWVNENEACEEFKEYWNYLNNTGTVDMPEWYSESLKKLA